MKTPLIIAIFSILLFTASSNPENGYKIGSEAMDFRLKNIDGKMVSLSDYTKAKGYIVIFTCNTCPYAKLYEERIIALDKRYTSQGFPVIAINPNDSKIQPEDSYENMQIRAKEKGFTFPYLVDETQNITKAYGATRTPHVFVLQKVDGKNKVAYIGAIDNNHKDAKEANVKYVEDAVDALLSGRKVKENFTKAIGCGIKWRES